MARGECRYWPAQNDSFLVKAGTEGFSVENPYDKVSMPGTETVTLNFDNVFVPEADLLGNVDEAMKDVRATLCEGSALYYFWGPWDFR